MPRLTKEQLENVRYISLSDFSNQIERIDNAIDKRKFAVQYLVTYGLSGDPDFELQEAIHFVRVKLSESIDFNNADLNTKVFLANPVKYLNVYAHNAYNKFDLNPNSIDDALISEHYHNLQEELNPTMGEEVASLDRNKNAIDVRIRMAINMGGQRQLDNCVKNAKPGFFSRLFNTSSEEAKNLERVYKEFNTQGSRGFGNLNNLEQAGLAYLHHKFPNINLEKSLPTVDDILKLDKTGSARALLSLKAIEAARAQKAVESFTGMGNLNTVNDVKVEELLSEDTLIDEVKVMENLANADKANKLDELKDGEEMNLDDEKLVEPQNDDSEEYALDEEEHPSIIDVFNNTFEKEIVEANEELGESKIETENIKKAQEEEAELRKHFKDGKFRDELNENDEFQEYIKEDSEIFIDLHDIEEKLAKHEYQPKRDNFQDVRYESPMVKKLYEESPELKEQAENEADNWKDL